MESRLNSLGQGGPWGVQRPDEQWGLEMGTEPSGGTRVLCTSTLILSHQREGETAASHLLKTPERGLWNGIDTAGRQGGCCRPRAWERRQEDLRDAQPVCSGTPKGTKGPVLILQRRWKRTQCRLDNHSLGWGGSDPGPKQVYLPGVVGGAQGHHTENSARVGLGGASPEPFLSKQRAKQRTAWEPLLWD